VTIWALSIVLSILIIAAAFFMLRRYSVHAKHFHPWWRRP
jgi:positive regulator of sigma E activity